MSDGFHALLAEAGVEFRPPPEYLPCAVRDNAAFRYQHALRSPTGDLELRYRIDVFARLEADRKAAAVGIETLASANLDSMHAANFMAILFNLSGGAFVEPTVLRPESTALLYAADWCALAFLRLADKGFAGGRDSAFFVSVHKAGVADIHVIGLYDDPDGPKGKFDKDALPAEVKLNLAPLLRFTGET